MFYVTNISLVLSTLLDSRWELLIDIHTRFTCRFCVVFTRNMHLHCSSCICGFRPQYEFRTEVFICKSALFPHIILH